MIDDSIGFSFDEDEDSRSIGDLIDLIKNRYAEEDEKREKEKAATAESRSSDEPSNYESNIAAIAKAVKESNERQKVDSAKHDNDRVKRQQTEEKKAAASRTSNAGDDRKIAQFSKVNADEIRKAFATLNMQQVVKNLDMYTSSINKYIDGMHTIMSMGTSFYDSLHSRLASKAASENIDQTAMRAKASEISSDMKTVIDSKQTLGPDTISSIPQTGSSAGSSSDDAMKSVSNAISKALQAGKSVTKTPGIVSEATDTIAKPASEALDSAVTSKIGTAASGALADGAETAATGAIGSGIAGATAGAAGDAAGAVTDGAAGLVADAAGGAAGGGLMSLAGSLLTKVNPVLAGVTAVGALAKAGMEGYRDAQRQGNAYGLGAGEGAKMMASGGWQDAQKFLGFTDVSGKDLANYRSSASSAGLSYGSEAFNASIELKKSIKDSGLPDSMMSMADQMLKTGASTDAVKSSMDALKDTAKATGQSLDDITKSASGIGNKINQATGDNNGVKMAADVQSNLIKTVKDATGATIGVEDAHDLISNKAFLQGLGSLNNVALTASKSSATATRYLNEHPELASKAYQRSLLFRTVPGTSESDQYINENSYDSAGLGATIGSVDRARKFALGGSAESGSDSASRKSRSNSDAKSSSDISIKISADDGLYAKMAKKDETLQRIYAGSDSMRIGK
jgi:hypothetical protein